MSTYYRGVQLGELHDDFGESHALMTHLFPLIRRLLIYDIFVNCNWVATRWQLFVTHINTKNTGNVTKQTIHRTTQQLGRLRAVPRLCRFYPGICLTTEKKHGKTSVRVVHSSTVCYFRLVICLPSLKSLLTHCGRVTQICVFHTVKLGTSASSP